MKRGVKTTAVGCLFLLASVSGPIVIVRIIIGTGFFEARINEQFKVPGSIRTTVEEPGTHCLWNDYKTVFQNEVYNSPKLVPDGVEIKIQDEKTGEQFDLIAGGLSISCHNGSRSQSSLGYVEIPRPCTIRINVSGKCEERVFSFSPIRLPALLGLVFGILGFTILFHSLGLVLVVWGIVKQEARPT
jgi:hypothetical protein